MVVAKQAIVMKESGDSRKASGAVVGLFLVLLVGTILGLGATGALAAPADGSGSHIGIVR